jgi:hypothetical protein
MPLGYECEVIAVGVPGPPGAGGTGSGGTLTMTGTAAVALSGHRAVYRRPDGLIDYASANNLGCLHEAIWVTTGAATMGGDVSMVMFGEMSEPSWTWVPGVPIFLGINGVLTQTAPLAPAADFLVVLGYVPITTKMFVDRQPSIDLI